MAQRSFANRRSVRRLLPLVTSVLLLAGCDSGGGSQTAEFPKMQKGTAPAAPSKTPAKGMDRVGSDSGVPNP
jgi:hypothetical protein